MSNPQDFENILDKYKKPAAKRNIDYVFYTKKVKNIPIGKNNPLTNINRTTVIFNYSPDEENADENAVAVIDNSMQNIRIDFNFENDKIKIIPKSDKIASLQLVNLINKRMKTKYNETILESDKEKFMQKYIIIDSSLLKEFFTYTLKFIPNLKDFCVITGASLGFSSNKFLFGENTDQESQYIIDELPIGDNVVSAARDYPEITKFLIQTGLAAIKSNRKDKIFEPFPTRFLNDPSKQIKRGDMSALNGTEISKNFNIINSLIGTQNYGGLYSRIMQCSTDEELSELIGFELFYLIRFIIMSNKMDIKHVKLFDNQVDTDVQQFQIVNKPEIEDAFRNNCKVNSNGESSFLFHGSGFENWYSIMRNGLKIMSNTKLMVNAAAYGAGVYLSDSFYFSARYSARGHFDGKIIVAVFEVRGNKENYRRNSGIFVVTNENDLILRYLLVLSSQKSYTFTQQISEKFGLKMVEEKKVQEARASTGCTRRLTKELAEIYKKKPDELGFRIEVDEDNITCWRVFLSNFPEESQLAKDMEKFGIDEIEVEMSFEGMYPLAAPFVRVIKPIFIYQTGRVTSGGSICTDFLTKESWSPAMRNESIILTLKTLFAEGEGRIDPHRLNQTYGKNEAIASFRRVANQHGWKIFS